MGRAGLAVYGTQRYKRERSAVLAGNPVCVHCHVRPAVEADHQPPLSCHHHQVGSGCCRLVPSCFRCGRKQGALLVNGYRPRQRVTATAITRDEARPVELAGFDVDDPVWDVEWLEDLRDVPRDAVWPRLMSAPHPSARGSYGADVAAYAATRSGKGLRWWQQLWMARLLEHDAEGRLVWDEAAVSLARQLGKSWGLRELIWWRLHQGARFDEPQDIVHTAKDVAICKEVQRPAWTWARRAPADYKVRLVNGQEEIELLADGSRWMLRAKEAVYGYAASLAVVDEAWKVPPTSVDEGLVPTMVERHSAQLLLVSTAHRRATALVMDRRATALADLSGTDVLLLEWSAPAGVELDDETTWRMASPHWSAGRRRLIAKKLTAARAGEADPNADEADPIAAFTAQWLNIWPPRASKAGAGDPLISSEAWEASEGTLAASGAGWVALEDNIGVGAAVAFVATDGERFEVDGRALDSWGDALRLARWFVDRRPGTHTIVGASLMSQVPNDWPNRLEVRKAGIAETRRGLPLFRSMVDAGRVVHDATGDLDRQVSNARVRQTANGTLALVSFHRSDLLRAAIWALSEAQTPAVMPAIR